MGIIKGQNLRLKVDGKVVAFAKSCTVHTAANLISYDNSSKDDTTFAWDESDVQSMNYDLSAEQLFSLDTDATGNNVVSILTLMLAGQSIEWSLEQCNSEKNRTVVSTLMHGNCIINDHSIQANNKENGSASFQAKGTGALSLGAKAGS